MAYAPLYSDDRRPRVGIAPGGYRRFWHPCITCGLVDAPLGYGVSLIKQKFGTWYCTKCDPTPIRRNANRAEQG